MQCTCECVAIDTCAVETFAVKATTRWFHAEDWVDSAIQVIFGSTPEDKELPKSLAKDMLVHLAKFATECGLTVPQYNASLKASIARLPDFGTEVAVFYPVTHISIKSHEPVLWQFDGESYTAVLLKQAEDGW